MWSVVLETLYQIAGTEILVYRYTVGENAKIAKALLISCLLGCVLRFMLNVLTHVERKP